MTLVYDRSFRVLPFQGQLRDEQGNSPRSALGLAGGWSPFVQEAHALTAARMPVQQSARVVERLTGLPTAPATLARGAKETGRQTQSLRRELDEQTRAGQGPQPVRNIPGL